MKLCLIFIIIILLKISISHSQSTKLNIYTSGSNQNPFIIDYEHNLLSIYGFCRTCPNYIISHGWGNGISKWMIEIKDELFKINPKINVFIVDWSFGSDTMNLNIGSDIFGYESAIKNINITVRELHNYFRSYVKKGFIRKYGDMVDLYCIGHSLGSHVCGLTGKLMKADGMKFSRISALDPAGPCFDAYPPENRLHMTDADYVDVIHTSKTFGLRKPIGHSDFYPNDGTKQPGCYLIDRNDDTDFGTLIDRSIITVFLCDKSIDFAIDKKFLIEVFKEFDESKNLIEKSKKIVIINRNEIKLEFDKNSSLTSIRNNEKGSGSLSDIEIPQIFSICSHSRSYMYFIQSMQNPSCKFQSTECSSWSNFRQSKCNECSKNQMGFYSSKISESSSVTYYLDVGPSEPYCLVKNNVMKKSLKSSLFINYCKSGSLSNLVEKSLLNILFELLILVYLACLCE
jgi:hypothetical protein